MSMADQAQAKQLKAQGAMTALFHPGLLWKEWRQYRSLFALFFFLIMLEPFFFPFYLQIFFPDTSMIANSGLSPSLWVVKTLMQNGVSFMEQIALIAVVLLAGVMLGSERGSSLNYLASTAVSRRQILAAKWLRGNLGIILCMFGLFLYMVALTTIDPPRTIPINQLFLWSARMTLALLALFSLALLSASIFSSILYSAAFTGFFLMLPMLLLHITTYPLAKYHILTTAQVTHANQWFNSLNIIDYISQNSGIGMSNASLSLVAMVFLLLSNLLFFFIAMRLFERNPLERNGEVLLNGNFKEIGRLVLTILLAPLWASNLADSWQLYLIYLLVLATAIYVGMGLLWKLMARLGLGRV